MAGPISTALQVLSTEKHKNALAYSATTFGATIMNSVFQFYYVKVYLDIYRLPFEYFQVAQVVFMVWNAVNDPLFGWLQDTSKVAWLADRQKNILYGAPLFVVSFLLPWFPQYMHEAPPWFMGLHLTFVLCFYDTMFTFVLLAQCSLFAELSPSQEDRQRLIKYSQIASLFGSTAVYISQVVSRNATDLSLLSTVCVFFGLISYCSFYYSAKNMKPALHRSSATPSPSSPSPPSSSLEASGDGESLRTWLTRVRQILRQRNFLLFVAMNFCQVFHTTFRSSFFALFADHLIGLKFGSEFLHFIAGLAYVLPQLLVLSVGPLMDSIGSYRLILWSFGFKVCASVLMYMVGRHSLLVLAVYFILDRSVAEATFALFNLCLADIIYADAELHRRTQLYSSTVFGLNALFTKPAQSLAPMFAVSYLGRHGYMADSAKAAGPTGVAGSSVEVELQDGMFLILCALPAMLGLVQCILWKSYTLRSKHTVDQLLTPDGM